MPHALPFRGAALLAASIGAVTAMPTPLRADDHGASSVPFLNAAALAHAPVLVPGLVLLLLICGAWIARETRRRSRAERRADTTHAFLQGVPAEATDCIERLNRDGRLVSISRDGQSMLEIDDPATPLGKAFDQLWPEAARRAVSTAIAAARGGKATRFIADRLTRTGLSKRLDTLVTPLTGSTDEPQGLLVISRDATHLSRAEASLHEANRKLILAEQLAHVGHWRIDLANESVTWSDEVYRIYGRDPATFQPALATTLQAYHTDDRAKALDGLQRAVVSRENYEFTARILRPDGETRDLLSRGFCEFSAEGELRAIFGVVADITDLSQAEAERRRSDLRYKWLADNVSDLIILQQMNGACLYVSPASRSMLGYEPDELAALNPIDLLHPSDRARLAALQGSLDETNRHATDVHRRRRKDGAWIWVEAAFHVTEDHDGGPAPLLLVAVRDVSERQERLEDLRIAKETADLSREEADKASQAKSDFIAAMSHELRTPLNSIIGFTGLILDNPILTASVRRHAELVRTSGIALLSVVNDVLDFSKVEAGRIALDPQPFSPLALAQDSLSIIRGGALGTALDISVTVDPLIPRILIGDEGRLRQILLNLLNNAVKFTAEGSVALALQLEDSGAQGERIRFSVADTGIGIPKARQNQLFQRFSQIDGGVGRDFGGSGLGLAICKGLVESMRGAIGIASDEGQGAMFWFTVTLPRGQSEASPAFERDGDGPSCRRTGGRLLLVEDVAVNQELGSLILKAAGHHVDVVAGGAEAVATVQARPYDLVLMDVHMPGMDGMAATRAIRALDHPARQIPIIAMTANVLPAQIRQFRAAGMDDHIGKPLNRVELYTSIDRWLARGERGPDLPSIAEAAEARLDSAIHDELVHLIGQATVSDIMARLSADLSQRFGTEPDDTEGRERLRQDAHAAVSSAGMLGFRVLSSACAALEMAIEEERPNLVDLVRTIRIERDWTIDRIAARTPTGTIAAGFGPAEPQGRSEADGRGGIEPERLPAR